MVLQIEKDVDQVEFKAEFMKKNPGKTVNLYGEPVEEQDGWWSIGEVIDTGEAKFYEVEVPDYNTLYVGVDAGQEGVWADTQRYLKDVGVEFTVKENKTPVYGKDGKILSPGELSDLLAPRDV